MLHALLLSPPDILGKAPRLINVRYVVTGVTD